MNTTEEVTIESETAHRAGVAYTAPPDMDHHDMTGESGEVEDHDPNRPERTVYRGQVGDMVSAGHGFIVQTATANGRDPALPLRCCAACGSPVRVPAPRWVCEFSGDVVEVPTFPGYGRNGARTARCGCNACNLAADVRGRGRPREVCLSADCERERDRRKRAEERERQNGRQRELAFQWVTDHPTMTDRDIAEQAGIRPARVNEARSLVAA